MEDTMKVRSLTIALAFLSTTAFAAEVRQVPDLDTASAFSALKSLAGEWQADTKEGKATLTYEVIAGGTTLIEREKTPGMAEMLTAYHLDGKRLLLTHYCMAGNQPRMQAEVWDPAKRELQFKFLDGTNLKPGAGHMHNVTLRLVNDRNFVSEWQFYENDQLKMAESFKYTRVR